MPDYRVTVTDEGDKVLQLAFNANNQHLEAIGKKKLESMDEFLSSQIEAEFGIAPEVLKATQEREAADAIRAKLEGLPITAITEISTAVDEVISKQPKTP